jgi:phosphoribosylanthranilate isomerase
VIIKICGITNLDDAMVACEAGADALGFNFAEEAKKRNRYIEPSLAKGIIDKLPDHVTKVGVTVNADPQNIQNWLEFVDCVQLHGEESAEFSNALGNKAIKAFRIAENFQPESLLAYNCRAWLLDAYVPGDRGGTGKKADWDTASKIVELGHPVYLAGGLTPENVAEAIEKVKPYGVDTAGGVESAPGVKDHERIRKFIENARNASLS